MQNLRYKHYFLVLLTIVAVFNYLDRFVLSLLLEPIKYDLQLNDSQLGLLTGIAFSLFYAIAGVPIARWADRGNRNTIISLTTALWSGMVALSALAGNFTQLLLARVGVAVGEAGCVPPALSLIADYFSREDRPRATSIYFLSSPIALIIGYVGGGWLAENLGWRMTFVVVGLPGIALAMLVKFTLLEPRLQHKASEAARIPSFKEVLTTLWRQETFPHIVTAFLVAYLFGSGILIWLPAFLMRSYAMGPIEVGSWLALVSGVCGILGVYLGGWLATRYAKGQESLHMRAASLCFSICGGLYVLAYIVTSKYMSLTCIAMLTFLGSLATGVIFSAIQSLVSGRLRSVAVSLVLLLANLVGAGLGPLAIGVLSDLLAPIFRQESLRYALVIFSPGYFWVAYHYWQASVTIEADIRAVELEENNVDISDYELINTGEIASDIRKI
ncbi:MFS transporter [SAR92 clade bacterium H231]|nr:MFS transporter [SAR92 clade bacterium H231]